MVYARVNCGYNKSIALLQKKTGKELTVKDLINNPVLWEVGKFYEDCVSLWCYLCVADDSVTVIYAVSAAIYKAVL